MTQFNLINVKNVTDFGAIGDGETDNTDAVEATIKAVVEIGGGTVYFPPVNISAARSTIAAI